MTHGVTAIAIGLVVAAVASAAQAQPPEPDALRARLAEVQQAQGDKLPAGAFESIAYTIDVAERIERGFAKQSLSWRARAARYLAIAEEGKDPIVAQRGDILMRGYQSALSTVRQGYAIYIPEGYDPSKRYPLMVMLHGGSASGNLFLGVVLGNNMNWKQYPIHLWDDYEPRWTPEWIVVAPDGFGQVMWRWMGEQDVLDVIDDVIQHYSVDEDRIVLGGLSNGGVGAYNIGMRHAWRFSVVEAIAGAPSWLQYSGGRMQPVEELALTAMSGMQLAENAINTDFRYYHGHEDTGPMKPRFVKQLTEHIETLDVPYKEKWFDAGHDLLYLVHRHGRNYEKLAEVHRERSPKEVRLVSGDYRANRQHWVTLTRVERYPKLARIRAAIEDEDEDGPTLRVETDNALAFSVDLRDAPLASSGQVRIEVDGKQVYEGERAPLGHVLHLARDKRGWHTGFLQEDADALEKRPGSSGPITDAYFDSMIHVYGTQDEEREEALKKSAERGAKGWPLWLWRLRQRVVADSEVTDAMMREHHLVLYGTPGSNEVLERIAGRLPIRIEADAVVLGEERHEGPGVGVKFVHPNPLAPERYVIVQAGPTIDGVNGGHRLPDFLPDYVVYDKKSAASRPRLVANRSRPPRAMGYFDRYWRLSTPAERESGDDASKTPKAPRPPRGAMPRVDADAGLPIPPAPPAPPRTRKFTASASSQAGKAARVLARRTASLKNFRALTHGATWINDPAARWSIDDNRACLRRLHELRVPVRTWEPLLATPVPTPVEVIGRVRDVWFRMTHSERTLLMSCEMAARLPTIAKAAKRQSVIGIDVMSSYRETPRASFHTAGLALDLLRFFTPDDVLSVMYDFEETPMHETCEAPQPQTRRARALLDIICRLAASRQFSTLITPNYNEGHRDHFHIDIRPDDPRLFLR